ncbi:MAG: hypothetical protein JW976_12910 [Syntrophaceae bacterium]|nr:hypothetical protein [Syntrophaceae bacterium]
MTKTDKAQEQIKNKYLEENYGKNILPLSLFDNAVRPGGNPIEIIFFYKNDTDALKFKKSILKTIKYYNLFSSRLIMVGENRFALQYCTDGFIPTILPAMNISFSNINLENFKKRMVHVKTLPGEPLFAVTGLPIKDGILVGISCSHAVADGISILLFLYAWMCITDRKNFLHPSPQRLFKGAPISSDKIDKAFTPSLSKLSVKVQNRYKSRNIKTYSKREYFSEEFLNKIKDKTKSENGKYVISHNQIINALLLKKFHNQILPNTDRIVLRNPITLRDIHPDIDSLYIGNAIFICFAEFTKNEIDNMSISQIVYRINESITKVRNKNYIKGIAYLSEYGIEFKPEIFKDYPSYNMVTDIVSANLTHLNDLESLGVGTNLGDILYIDSTIQTGFTILKEKSGSIFAEITSMYPFN